VPNSLAVLGVFLVSQVYRHIQKITYIHDVCMLLFQSPGILRRCKAYPALKTPLELLFCSNAHRMIVSNNGQ
jgi:hypothetical protein